MTPEQVARIIREADEIGTQNGDQFDASVGWSTFKEELIKRFSNAFAEENHGFNRSLFDSECWGE